VATSDSSNNLKAAKPLVNGSVSEKKLPQTGERSAVLPFIIGAVFLTAGTFFLLRKNKVR
jgi:LPXTG-motif cell wall-anchored protein